MVLVDYSDSETEVSGSDSRHQPQAQPRCCLSTEKEQSTPSLKRKHDAFTATSQPQKSTPPPLPSAFRSLYTTNVRTSISDDSSLHQGRKRQLPHVEGNWLTHVYLEWYPSRAESAMLESIMRNFQVKDPAEATSSSPSKLHNLLQSELDVQLPLHVSLSAPLMLRTEQRAEFLEKLEIAVVGSGVRPFHVHVTGLDWVPNSERTRWFLVLRLSRPGNDGLNHLLAATNCIARDSGLEMLYTDQEVSRDVLSEEESQVGEIPAGGKGRKSAKRGRLAATIPADHTSNFHFSIAWQLQDPGKGIIESADVLESMEYLSISCDCVKVKIGNAIHDIPLPGRRLSEQGLGGT